MGQPLWEKLSFSGLKRYVMISETVYAADHLLSQADRAEIVQDLIARDSAMTPEDVLAECEKVAADRFEANVVRAAIVRNVERGG